MDSRPERSRWQAVPSGDAFAKGTLFPLGTQRVKPATRRALSPGSSSSLSPLPLPPRPLNKRTGFVVLWGSGCKTLQASPFSTMPSLHANVFTGSDQVLDSEILRRQSIMHMQWPVTQSSSRPRAVNGVVRFPPHAPAGPLKAEALEAV